MDRWTLALLNRQLTLSCLDNSTVDYTDTTRDYYYHPLPENKKKTNKCPFKVSKKADV